MKNICASVLLFLMQAAHAGFGGMTSVESESGGGSISLGAVVCMVLFFGGIFWFVTRFQNE